MPVISEEWLTTLPKGYTEAKDIGARAYFTGKPCKYGHITYRLTSVRHCYICSREGTKMRMRKYRQRLKSGLVSILVKLVTYKKCGQCQTVKHRDMFYKDRSNRSGLTNHCKSCRTEYSNEYCARPLVKQKRRKRENSRYESDKTYKLTKRMRASLRESVMIKSKKRTWEAILGFTVDELCRHLERTLSNGMTLETALNSGYEVDHIIPVSALPCVDEMDDNFQLLWSLSNLRIIPQSENRRKSAKREFLL